MPRVLRIPIVFALLAAAGQALAAQTTALSPSPTLPNDTLEASQPADSFPADSLKGDSSTSQADPGDVFPDAAPVTPADSAALRELKAWIRSHPDLTAPPPARAVLVRV